jgi:histidinol-phosphate aminotransferase
MWKARYANEEPYCIPSTIKHRNDMGEFPLTPLPQHVVAAFQETGDLSRYATPDCELHDRLKHALSEDGTVVLTNGSDNALRIILDTVCERNTRIVIPTPTYPHFEQFARLRSDNIVNVAYPFHNVLNGRPTEELMAEVQAKMTLDTAGVLYLVNPNMPVGYYIEPSLVFDMAQRFPDWTIILDEAYAEFASPAHSLVPPPNVVITRTFSKFYQMPRIRLGYIIANPTSELAHALRVAANAKDISDGACRAALAILSDTDYATRQRREFMVSREYLQTTAFADVPEVRAVVPSMGYLLLFVPDAAALVEHLLTKHRIMVRDKSKEYPGFVRVTIGPLHVMKEIVTAIRTYYARNRQHQQAS